jgi:hypothetical protein
MITIEDVIKYSKPHHIGGEGRMVRFHNDHIMVSIVGGTEGLYGDFKDTFELAVFNNDGSFMTNFFFPEYPDNVVGYLDGKDLMDFLNKIFKNGFQVT